MLDTEKIKEEEEEEGYLEYGLNKIEDKKFIREIDPLVIGNKVE